MNKYEGRAICWDLDGTLGLFTPILDEWQYGNPAYPKARPPEKRPTIALRYGIKDLLSELREAGFTHLITTRGDKRYAKEAAQRTGLSGFFPDENIYENMHLHPQAGGRKSYAHVAENLNLQENAHDLMLVVGNSKTDQPIDQDALVFVFDDSWPKYDALVLREIIVTLLEKGEGSFRAGFDRIFSDGSPTHEETAHPQPVVYDLRNGINFTLEYKELETDTPHFGTKKYPAITKIDAPDYIQELDPIL